MRPRVPVRTPAVWISACAALALAGCSTSATGGKSTVTVKGDTLTVYASQPPGDSGGQQASDILDAEQLALQGAGKAGPFTVKLVKLDGNELSDNARTAVENETSIAYLGELQPGTSQIPVEIVNQQGLLVVSPADTAAYLTQPVPAPLSTSPSSYYPARSTYNETFARVVPNSSVEARAIVSEMQGQGVSRLYVSDDGSQYGEAVAQEVSKGAKAASMTLVSSPAGADGVFYGGSLVSASARATATHALDKAAAASPSAKLFAPSGLYSDSFVSGLSPAAAAHLVVSSPGFLPKDLTPAGRAFVRRFRQAFGHQPVPQAIFGYEAMSALLDVLDKAGSKANERAVVVSDFRSLKDPANSVIGQYSISGGDPSIAPIIFARVRGGKLLPFKFVQLQG
jgi:ABC-type branched-subunit amino acid transport system substrate-binding protein